MNNLEKPIYKFPNATNIYIDLLSEWKSKARPIVIWAGAGLSAPAKLPNWEELQRNITQTANDYIESLSPDQKREKQHQFSSLQSINNPWIAFEKLESILGPNNFEAEVKRALGNALKCEVPKIYIELWKLGISGMLTLNIDRLASRAYNEAQVQDALVERSGFETKALIGSINAVGQGKFIANLHGAFEDPTTWVFTESKRKALFNDQRYQEFVRDTLKYCTVVMIGVSAHDIAIREHLSKLKSDGLGSHAYWITTESSTEALELAEKSGIRFISYPNISKNHSDLLKFIDDIRSFTSKLIDAPPVVARDSNTESTSKLPSIEELLILSPNDQRSILNAEACKILTIENENSYQKFEDFCRQYNRAIHAAGLFDTEDGSEKVLNYTLSSLEDGEGGFGTIWRGFDEEGNQVAIKVFKHDLRKNQSLLKAFRRGVRSLKLLAKHNLPGIVEFKTACEIPPVLVMEWIEGVNLFTAVNQGKFKDWETRLRVAKDLAEAIYRAHSVPERVLHRDIKPQNVMFRDFYQEEENADLVVLDFDLSWHVGALEKSVLAKGANPYLAPEQLTSLSDATSRSAAVDAYGLGMTLYFLCTGTPPTPFMHQSSDWNKKLESISNQPSKQWKSIPKRISRLINLCTKHDQNLRPSFSQITAEIERLNQVINHQLQDLDIRLFSEEIAARTEALNPYDVQPDGSIQWKSSTQRLRVQIRSEDSETISVKFEFVQTGNEKFNSLHTARDLVSKIYTFFPPTVFAKSPTFSHQHGHYIAEIFLHFEPSNSITQLEVIQKSVATTMEKLMAAGQ